MAEAAILGVVLLATVVAPVVLYALVRDEHQQGERMDRQAAEQAARHDTRDRD